ncbi:MAG TPA: hypothetical protein PK379_10020 [Candidatus Hydrogenedentes bacterium]|nr:hypothetical protein [Candidatus Hydrogenedentota bacterium]HOK90351.1 hypothetical protein [Candidatus Hydrogenedentota bacterium]HOV61125.1 hypothetical protein [Candidatus Hydrogenedentota bacterium]
MTGSSHADNPGQGALRVALFGADAQSLAPIVAARPELTLVERDPDVVVCYGGDGTLLGAELRWPGRPKVPILNSRVGNRCIAAPPERVIAALASGTLERHTYEKLECAVHRPDTPTGEADFTLACLNEINVHMGRINSAVRFRLWVNDEPFDGGVELVGDGFIACTAFGSTAYFNAITRCVFTRGIGVAFKATAHQISHMVLPETARIRFRITRGPAVLAFDSSPEYFTLDAGDELVARRHPQSAEILSIGPMRHIHHPFRQVGMSEP